MEVVLILLVWSQLILIPIMGLILIGMIQHYKKIRRAIQFKLEMYKYRK